MHAEALGEGEKFMALSGGGPTEAPVLGYIYARMGKQAEARQMIEQLKNLSKQRYVPAYDFAIIYTGLGEKDQAFESLRKAVEERDSSLVFLKLEPQFDSIRSDPRFATLLEDVGLSQ